MMEKTEFIQENEITLAAKKRRQSYADLIAPKSISQARKDIQSWKKALKQTQLIDHPKWYLLQQLYREVLLDALLKSQYENRRLKALARKPVLVKPNGDIDEDQTALLHNSIWAKDINRNILDANFFGFSVIEFTNEDDDLQVNLINRDNINPRDGFLYPDYTDDKKIPYREVREYGTWILEFYEKDNQGLINAAIPHVLFKKFAESCWSELCEINGIPPRVLKTNTADPVMMARGKKMMQDMGAAAWLIIDENENLEWASSVPQNGDVYANLINLCNNEISMLISGAIIGQDTKHGNRSKDESAQEMLWDLIDDDLDTLTKYWNTKVIPALQNIGILKGDVSYGYEQAEDTEQLWKMTSEILPYKNVDDEWIKEKFGIEVTGDRTFGLDGGSDLKAGEDLFI